MVNSAFVSNFFADTPLPLSLRALGMLASARSARAALQRAVQRCTSERRRLSAEALSSGLAERLPPTLGTTFQRDGYAVVDGAFLVTRALVGSTRGTRGESIIVRVLLSQGFSPRRRWTRCAANCCVCTRTG